MKRSIPELVKLLNYYTEKYNDGHPEISDKEWDELYFELETMEKDAGYSLEDSPTQKITYSVVNQLNKITHSHKMLSLDKTKDINIINNFLGEKQFYIEMLKLDGLTCSLTYRGGHLVAAETRGNGLIGEDILHNAQVIPSIPKHINYYEELVVDGEIISTTKNFEKFSSSYKNPRNFAAGSIRLLDSRVCAKRGLRFIAWDVITGLDNHISHTDPESGIRAETKLYTTSLNNTKLSEKLYDLIKLGFITVPCIVNIGPVLEKDINRLKESASELGYPIDGLVFKFDNIAYGKTLGETSHHFKNAIAFKFYDEVYDTVLKDIEWSMGRTGVLTPIAIFEPIECDDAEITRASLHNVSIMEESLGRTPFIGEKIQIYRANMIIPQVYYAEKQQVDNGLQIPEFCPICSRRLEINDNNGVKTLYCPNEYCSGKILNRLDHFCGKKGLDIKGISLATLDKLMEWGWIKSLKDIFTLSQYKEEWSKKDSFGEKSVTKILNSIEKAKDNITLSQYISAIGIPFIGLSLAKVIVKEFPTWKAFRVAVSNQYDFAQIPTFGEIKSQSILSFDYTEADEIVEKYLFGQLNNEKIVIQNTNSNNTFVDGKVFCITGKLHNFKNRDELVALIENSGGRVVSNISTNVNYLINNDIKSLSSKNKKAKELNIPIISEENFLAKLKATNN